MARKLAIRLWVVYYPQGIMLCIMHTLKDNSTMDKTEAQKVSYGILYLNPSSHQCQPTYKKYNAV